MALTTGTVANVEQLRQDDLKLGTLKFCNVYFTMSGTYDQSANSSLVGVPTLIQNSKRNGKTVTMRYVTCGGIATKASNGAFMALKTVAISSADVTFEITDGDYSTELAAAAIPAQADPFCILVGYTEA